MKEEKTNQTGLDFDEPVKKELDAKLEDKPLDIDMMRVASTVLLKAALIYRDKYIPKDIIDLKELPVMSIHEAKRSGAPKNISSKGVERLHNERVKLMEKTMTGFSDRIGKEINVALSKTDKNGADWINMHGEYIARCMKQIIPAHDKDELYMLMVSYNAGQLDFLFEESRKARAELVKTETLTSDETTAPSTEK